MRVRVVANFVTFVNQAAHQVRIGLSVLSDNKECSRNVFLFENIENCRRPPRIGAIIKGQRDKSGVISFTLNYVGRRDGDEVFVFDVTIGIIYLKIAPAVLRSRYDLEYFAAALEINLVTIDNSL